jgi:zinc D-Ala-D-Ala dipeptidase
LQPKGEEIPAWTRTEKYSSAIAAKMPRAMRAPEGSIDMGTGYDCSDAKANTAATSITPAQRHWRNVLVVAMARQGFANC